MGWTATAGAQEAQYKLGSGDQLRITVFGHEDLSGNFLVEGSGLVSLPLVGAVPLGGKTIIEAEATIIAALKPDYLKNPRVSVQVLNYRPFYIIGEVNSPGSYAYVSGMTVLEAVAIAGGFTYRAKEGEMTITRGSDDARREAEAVPETLVLPGDVIKVPERFF
ncbi:MAG TPA: polysaccharide biosynthesis/export family protein [Afifellaceae bacterium]|nr:polysaccharide biosynthesis/export family protein [Afifellaceae bacterium]